MEFLFPEDIFSHLERKFMHPLGEKLSCNPCLCICPLRFRPFAFHYIIPLRHIRII